MSWRPGRGRKVRNPAPSPPHIVDNPPFRAAAAMHPTSIKFSVPEPPMRASLPTVDMRPDSDSGEGTVLRITSSTA